MSDALSNGCATISGLAALENARVPDEKKPNTILFDVQLWVWSESRLQGSPLLAVMKYYNDDGTNFDPDDVGLYFITANVSRMQDMPELTSSALKVSDYSIAGDIISLIPAGDIASVDARHRPIVHVSGVVTEAMPAECKFDLAPEQYVWILREWKESKNLFPIRCVIKDSPRWGKKKPAPRKGFQVSITGFLSSVMRNQKSGYVDYFEVELEKIVYQSKSPISGTTSTPSSVTPAKRGVKFTFERDTTPCPPAKKARLQSQSSTSTLTSEDPGSPPALEYVATQDSGRRHR